MEYLDSWVWLEYVFDGDRSEEAIECIDIARNEGGAMSTIGLTEVDYITQRELGRETADLLTSAIEDFDEIHLVPVTSEIALYASELRAKYYERRDREISYADVIHVATAVLTDCETIHTGDADFSALDEIETTIH